MLWLESVEANMAELEIDKDDVHDRSKWRRHVNVMKRKSNLIGKRTINYVLTSLSNDLPQISIQYMVRCHKSENQGPTGW